MATFLARSEGCYAGPLKDGLWSIYNGQTSPISIQRIAVSPSATPNAGGTARILLQRKSPIGPWTPSGQLTELVNPVGNGSTAPGSGLYVAPDAFETDGLVIRALTPPVSFVTYGSGGGQLTMPLARSSGLKSSVAFAAKLPIEGITTSSTDPIAFICSGCLAPFTAMMQVTCKFNDGLETAVFVAPVYSRAATMPMAVLSTASPMTIVQIEFFDLQSEFQLSQATNAPQFRLARSNPVRGQQDIPVGLNPLSTYPGLVEITKNFPFVVGKGLNQRDGLASHFAQTIQVEQQAGNLRGLVSYVQDATKMLWPNHDRVVYEAHDADSSIVLMPGEALSLAAGNISRLENSPYLTMNVECVFDYTPPVVVAGQKHHVIGSSIVGRF